MYSESIYCCDCKCNTGGWPKYYTGCNKENTNSVMGVSCEHEVLVTRNVLTHF